MHEKTLIFTAHRNQYLAHKRSIQAEYYLLSIKVSLAVWFVSFSMFLNWFLYLIFLTGCVSSSFLENNIHSTWPQLYFFSFLGRHLGKAYQAQLHQAEKRPSNCCMLPVIYPSSRVVSRKSQRKTYAVPFITSADCRW